MERTGHAGDDPVVLEHRSRLGGGASLFGIKTVFWRDFLRTFQQSSTDDQITAALEKLKQRIESAGTASSSKGQAALTIIGEVERLLEIVEP